MKSFNSLFNFCLYFVLGLFSCRVFSDEVPVILWDIEGNSLNVKPVSALAHDDGELSEIINDVEQNKAKLLVYSLPAMSLEDLSPNEKMEESNYTLNSFKFFLDTHKYMFLPSVRNPLKHIHRPHCKVQEIVVDGSMDQNVLNSISTAFQRSCIVILHISNAGLIGTKGSSSEELKKVFQPLLNQKAQNIIGIFTALKSSWGSNSVVEHRMSRSLLASEDKNYFVNINDCLILYAENASLNTGKSTVGLTLPPADTKGSECGDSSAILSMNLQGDDGATYNINFNFTSARGAWKTSAKVKKGSESETDFQTKDLEAPVGYSFSCGEFQFRSKGQTNPMTITFKRFQVQPFKVQDKKFADSFDCVTWFTIPIWMGLIVTILFVAIINCGVYSIFSISTMDRFDDPKGKTITVAVSE